MTQGSEILVFFLFVQKINEPLSKQVSVTELVTPYSRETWSRWQDTKMQTKQTKIQTKLVNNTSNISDSSI